MKISAVVATYNRERFLPDALEGLRRQTLNPALFEIIIVNNNSTDRTKEISLKFIQDNPRLKVIYCEEYQQGLSFGRNRGIMESTCPIVTFIDDDAITEDHFLEKAVEYMEAHKDVAAVGGKIFAKYLNKKPVWMSKYIQAIVGHVDYGDTIFEYPPGKYPYGSNMSIDRQAMIDVGMFNTALGRIGSGGLGGEEKDMFDKLKANGKKIMYIPGLLVYHSVDDSRLTKESLRKLAIGVGASEKLRVQAKGPTAVFKVFMEYLFKFGASCILALLFCLQLQVPKAYYLLFIRWYATKGFIEQ